MYVGSVIERKNLLAIVKAIHSLKSFLKIPLVVIGNGDKYKEKVKDYVKKNGLEQLVFFLDNVANEDMPCIYFKSKIFIYPSVYEGFGIPIIEALYTRTPVIASNTSSLPEAAGNGAHYVNPNDVSEIADAIIRLLTNKDYYTQLINNGFAYVQKFKSELLSNQLFSLYNSTIIKK
ncbi:MAG: glycosyltransferase family 4 protein [Bacteroidales bacterium]|nr:glycosyltransferase family 4 protein [Bacteroidales bacterium]